MRREESALHRKQRKTEKRTVTASSQRKVVSLVEETNKRNRERQRTEETWTSKGTNETPRKG